MRRLGMFLSLLLFVGSAAAKESCHFGSAQAADNLERTLREAPTCNKAASILSECRWGSSADVGFASIVNKKCEKELLPKLSTAGKARLQKEAELCHYEYANQEGTLFISEASMCVVSVLQRFTAKPELAEEPMPRASFDCAKAATPLEKAICSDEKLGQADIVLERAYRPLLRSTPAGKRSQIVDLQKAWRVGVEKKCAVGKDPLPVNTRECVRKEFEERFLNLDGCSVGGWEECLFQLKNKGQ
jgi:uncharacterized protein YecT (DUF1311 family)